MVAHSQPGLESNSVTTSRRQRKPTRPPLLAYTHMALFHVVAYTHGTVPRRRPRGPTRPPHLPYLSLPLTRALSSQLSLLPPLGIRSRGSQLPSSLPVFGSQQNSLNILAAVAAGTQDQDDHGTTADDSLTPNPLSGLHTKGPYNPVALLPAKWRGKYLTWNLSR